MRVLAPDLACGIGTAHVHISGIVLRQLMGLSIAALHKNSNWYLVQSLAFGESQFIFGMSDKGVGWGCKCLIPSDCVDRIDIICPIPDESRVSFD